MTDLAANAPLPDDPSVAEAQPEEKLTPAQEHAEARDKNDREVFDGILDKYGRGDKEETTEETPQLKGEQAPPSETVETEPEDPSGPSETRKADEQYLRLKANVPQAALDTLDDEAVQLWAAERRDRESVVDAAIARAARAEKETDPTPEQDTEGEPSAPTPELSSVLDGLAEDLALTDDGRARLNAFSEAITAPFKAELEAVKAAVQSSQQADQVKTIDSVRQQVSERFAGLSDDSTWEAVLTDAAALEQSPRYAGSGRPPGEYLPELIADMARVHGLEEGKDPNVEKAEREAAEAEAERRARLDADPGPTPSRTPPAVEKTGRDADWEVYQRNREKYRTG